MLEQRLTRTNDLSHLTVLSLVFVDARPAGGKGVMDEPWRLFHRLMQVRQAALTHCPTQEGTNRSLLLKNRSGRFKVPHRANSMHPRGHIMAKSLCHSAPYTTAPVGVPEVYKGLIDGSQNSDGWRICCFICRGMHSMCILVRRIFTCIILGDNFT